MGRGGGVLVGSGVRGAVGVGVLVGVGVFVGVAVAGAAVGGGGVEVTVGMMAVSVPAARVLTRLSATAV